MRKVPAILVCDAGTGSLRIAGLTVLDRLVITAHRAGCTPITIVSDAPPSLARTEAMGIRPSMATCAPAGSDAPNRPALMITGAVLVDSMDLARVVETGGQLISQDGSLLPVKMAGSNVSPVIAQGVAAIIHDDASAREAERRLWRSLGSNADGVVDRYLNRPIGRILSKVLVRTPISPNAVSILSIGIGVASAWFFTTGEFVLGAVILQLSAIIDCVDGDLARALFKQSRVGKWLDLAGDQIVHFSVFAAIGFGVARTNPAVPAITLGMSAALGVFICFPIIVRTLRLPVAERGRLLNKLIDAAANRDFSILLLVLALAGKMELFLWMAGIGVHVFWATMLLLQNAGARNRATGRRRSA